MPDLPRTFSCRGCGRDDLHVEDMVRDGSKPSGFHSRCADCKKNKRRPKTPVPEKEAAEPVVPDPAAVLRRDALIELVRRHRDEFDDIVWSLRRLHKRQAQPSEKDKAWVNLASKSMR